MNEKLLKWIKKHLPKFVEQVQFNDSVEEIDILTKLRQKKRDTFACFLEIKKLPFKKAILTYRIINRRLGIMNIMTSAVFPVTSVYPIQIGFVPIYKRFAPMLGPMNPEKIIVPPEKYWWYNRALHDGAPSDKLSNYLNRIIDTNQLWNSFWPLFSMKKPRHKDTYYAESAITIFPRSDSILIQVSECYEFSPKKLLHQDNFLPKIPNESTFTIISKMWTRYQDFITRFSFENYPKDKYLTGIEAFYCKNCNSEVITYPFKFYLPKKSFLTFATKCPSCQETRNLMLHCDDMDSVKVGVNLFWTCSHDNTKLQIIHHADSGESHTKSQQDLQQKKKDLRDIEQNLKQSNKKKDKNTLEKQKNTLEAQISNLKGDIESQNRKKVKSFRLSCPSCGQKYRKEIVNRNKFLTLFLNE